MAGRLSPVQPADITGIRAHYQVWEPISRGSQCVIRQWAFILISRTASVRQNHLTDITKHGPHKIRSLDVPECSRHSQRGSGSIRRGGRKLRLVGIKGLCDFCQGSTGLISRRRVPPKQESAFPSSYENVAGPYES